MIPNQEGGHLLIVQLLPVHSANSYLHRKVEEKKLLLTENDQKSNLQFVTSNIDHIVNMGKRAALVRGD